MSCYYARMSQFDSNDFPFMLEIYWDLTRIFYVNHPVSIHDSKWLYKCRISNKIELL